MADGRSYGEGCAVAHGLDVIGERWALLIVRELLLGPKRFNALQAGIRNASSNMLSQRLREMEQAGVVHRVKLGPPADTTAWELTRWGYDLEPIILTLGQWASRSPSLDPTGPFSPDALMLHLKARFDTRNAPSPGAYEIRLDGAPYSLTIHDNSLQLTRGSSQHPDLLVDTDLATLLEVVKGRLSFDRSVKTGRLTLIGNRDQALALLHAK